MIDFNSAIQLLQPDTIDNTIISEDTSIDDVYFSEKCIFSDTITKINELALIRMNNTIKLYESIADNRSDIAVSESFSDYYVQASEMIKEFMIFMQDKLNEFDQYMRNFISGDKIINQHKDKLQHDVKFYKDNGAHEDYIYSINNSVPNMNALLRFNANLFDKIINIDTNDISVNSFQQAIEAIDIEQDYRKFRGEILGLSKELSMSEFGKAVYQIFRNNNTEEKLIIDTATAKDIIDEWFHYDNVSKGLHAELKTIFNAFNSLLEQIASVSDANNNMTIKAFTNLLPGDINVEYIDGHEIDNYAKTMPADLMLQIDAYCKIKVDQLQTYSNIISMVISAKLDAVKAKYEQDRVIILDICRALDHPEIFQVPYDSKVTDKSPVKDLNNPKELINTINQDIKAVSNQ